MSVPRGLSLIELVVAMAIFGLIAVLGAQALAGLLRQRDTLSERAALALSVHRAVAQVRADLGAAVPMLFHPPDADLPRSAIAPLGTGFALSTGGQPLIGDDGRAALHRVEWRLEDGKLTRSTWPTLIPATPSARHPPMPVADGVTALQVRTYWPGIGWTDGATPPRDILAALPDADAAGPATPEVYSDALPAAVEIVLRFDGVGDVDILQALR